MPERYPLRISLSRKIHTHQVLSFDKNPQAGFSRFYVVDAFISHRAATSSLTDSNRSLATLSRTLLCYYTSSCPTTSLLPLSLYPSTTSPTHIYIYIYVHLPPILVSHPLRAQSLSGNYTIYMRILFVSQTANIKSISSSRIAQPKCSLIFW